MITIHKVEQGTPEWLELRAGKHTGSSAYRLLRGYTDPPQESTFGGNFWTKRGHILEDEALELYEAITKQTVTRPGFVTNENWPLCGYSPDALTDDFVVEVKCFSDKRHMKLYNGDIPLTVMAQIYFGMLICERKAARLVIYNPDLGPKQAFKIIKIPFKRAVKSNLMEMLAKIHERNNTAKIKPTKP
jgi:hypothetical protein